MIILLSFPLCRSIQLPINQQSHFLSAMQTPWNPIVSGKVIHHQIFILKKNSKKCLISYPNPPPPWTHLWAITGRKKRRMFCNLKRKKLPQAIPEFKQVRSNCKRNKNKGRIIYCIKLRNFTLFPGMQILWKLFRNCEFWQIFHSRKGDKGGIWRDDIKSS